MKIVVLAGGISTERDVSLVSGTEIYKALKSKGHNVVLLDVYLGYDGDPSHIFEQDTDWAGNIARITASAPDIEAVKASRGYDSPLIIGRNVIEACQAADIVFMALHGDFGENGKLQAAFDLMGIRYTGTDSFSAALAMDKAVAKQVFMMNGVNTPPSHLLTGLDDPYRPEYPCVVKICNGGSSIGVYIVNNDPEYKKALKEAFSYEGRVIVENYIKGREFTDCVIEGKALPIVEITPKEGFYDYKNKYQAGATIEVCPAPISPELTDRIQNQAIAAYRALGIRTYARIDFIVSDDDKVYCLEANTLPGMTPTSLIPQEAAAIGCNFPDLCEWIIKVSLKKYE
ncbi:MAG: D-alanine--D-alanine ligase [Lachnospiraceae bacterium]|nr:D-alanine--D-alanine ligase [Lachnospiraceae bacterium]